MSLATQPDDRVSHLARLLQARLERAGRLRRYTRAEVASHSSPDDAWIVVDGRVRAVLSLPATPIACCRSRDGMGAALLPRASCAYAWAVATRPLTSPQLPCRPAFIPSASHTASSSPARTQVYDITQHVLSHPGWTSGCGTSQLLAILRTLGTDCSEEVHAVHSTRALLQLQPFLIGVVAEGEGGGADDTLE